MYDTSSDIFSINAFVTGSEKWSEDEVGQVVVVTTNPNGRKDCAVASPEHMKNVDARLVDAQFKAAVDVRLGLQPAVHR